MNQFFTYAEQLVKRLKPIEHKTLLRAFGVEQLTDYNAQMNSVAGTCLIAVNGLDASHSQQNADSLSITHQYALIVCSPVSSNDPDTLFEATQSCYTICREIANFLMLDKTLKGLSNLQFNGVGPIGQNFYGVMLSFSILTPTAFQLNPALWQE